MFCNYGGVYCCEVDVHVMFRDGFADVCCVSSVVECVFFRESESVFVY